MDWHTSLILTWIAQDQQDIEELTYQMFQAAHEYCDSRQRRYPDLVFAKDASEYLEIASQRLAENLFANREVNSGKPVGFAIPFPLIQKDVCLFVGEKTAEAGQGVRVTLNRNAEIQTREIPTQAGIAPVKFHLHTTLQHRRESLSNKFKEAVREAKSLAQKKERDGPIFVPAIEDVPTGEGGTHSGVEARIKLQKIVARVGVRDFVDWKHDEPAWFDVIEGIFAKPEVELRLIELRRMEDAARRKAKSRAYRRILAAVQSLGLAPDRDRETPAVLAADSRTVGD